MSFLQKVAVVAKPSIYHGSPSKFSRFQKATQGKDYGVGIYFTENKDEALQYIDEEKGGYLYTVDLLTSKPFDVRDKLQAKSISDALNLDWQKVVKNKLWKNPSTGHSPEDKNNFFPKIIDELSNLVKDRGLPWYKAYDLFTPVFKGLGFDSIRDGVLKWWVLTDPKKIKILKVVKVRGTEGK